MKLNDLVVVEISERIVNITARQLNKLNFIGSSIPASMKPSTDFVDFLNLVCPEGFTRGLIALTVRYTIPVGKKLEFGYASFLINIIKTGDNLQTTCVSKNRRLGQIINVHSESYLEVAIDGQLYTTNPRGHLENKHIVSDANLLCRYLAETATKEVVEVAAKKYVAEISASKELANLHSAVEILLTNFGIGESSLGLVERIPLIIEKRLALETSYQKSDKYRSDIIKDIGKILSRARFGNRGKAIRNCILRIESAGLKIS